MTKKGRDELQVAIEKAMDMLEKFAETNGLELEGLVAFTFPDQTVQVETLNYYPHPNECPPESQF